MPGGYAQRWSDVYQEYIEFSRDKDQGHPSHILVEKIVRHGGNLTKSLGSLESYYEWVQYFSDLAHNAKVNPNAKIDSSVHPGTSSTMQKELEATEIKLCSRDMTTPYYRAAVVATNALTSVAEAVSIYIGGQGVGAIESSAEEKKLVRAFLKEIESISNEIDEDVEAYVTKTSSTLLALKAVGGTEHMPPLPPTPPKPPATG